MPTQVMCVTFDCHDPVALARFWATALSYKDVKDDEVVIADPTGAGPTLLFMPVPEAKVVKNRVHLDLRPETPIGIEVERLMAAGATVVSTLQDPDSFVEAWRWTVMLDPEGNEFCVGEPVNE